MDVKQNKFIEIVEQFLNELYKKFPNSNEIKNIKFQFSLTKSTFDWIDIFMITAEPKGFLIMEKNYKFIEECKNIFGNIDIKYYYDLCDTPSRDVIWSYLQTLYIIGCSYKNCQPKFIELVENITNNIN